jgi:phosphoribosylformylglycinamidine cyclo-ligase
MHFAKFLHKLRITGIKLEMNTKRITYSESGVNYASLDPVKTFAQKASKDTAKHLKDSGFEEVETTRGESAYVWQQGDIWMASVIEGLGTKNLVADAMKDVTGVNYYDAIGHDTVATIINDLVSVGASPLVIHAYWAVGNSKWFEDKKRIEALVSGWKSACDIAGASWGGGETPTLNGIIDAETIDLGGSAVGIIKNKKRLVTENGLKEGDRILMIKSTGINANGITLARSVAKNLHEGYATRLSDGKFFGEALLTKSNIYAKLIQDMFDAGVNIHYLSNITGHGLQKVMRSKSNFTYVLENIFEPQDIFKFIQKHTGLTDKEMYETYNMGMDYAIFIPKNDVKKADDIVKKNGFECIDAGYVENGERNVVIKPKNIILNGNLLSLKI